MALLLYKTPFTARMHDIDAAGVLFFARAFYYAHDTYESFLNHHEENISNILAANFILPISHTEAQFKAPIFLNEEIFIEVFLQEINESDFTLNYQFIDSLRKIRITVSTQHVCLEATTRKRKSLPDTIQKILKSGYKINFL